MKRLILLAALALVATASNHAQRYESQQVMPVYALDCDGATVQFKKVYFLDPGTLVDLVSGIRTYKGTDIPPNTSSSTGDAFRYRVISILHWHVDAKEGNPLAEQRNAMLTNPTRIIDTDKNGIIDHNDNPKQSEDPRNVFYCVPADLFSDSSFARYYNQNFLKPTPKIGTAIFPVKLRFGNPNDENVVSGNGTIENTVRRPPVFATDVTLGTSFALSWRVSHYHDRYITWLFSAGVTSVSLDSASIPYRFDAKQSKAAAFTLATGLMYEFQNKGQLGVVIGWDWLGGDTGRYWRYEGKPWLGIGIGIQVFSQTVGEGDQVKEKELNKLGK